MSEVMLRDVRAGFDVLGIFYGHPGVFVSPSHRAIALARDEGFEARMLPGVSAEDCMFSDIGFDPAMPGCMTQEATGFLISGKKLEPTVHNIIWQVGCVGVGTMEFKNTNTNFHVLVDRIEEDLGPDQKVVHYNAAVLPQDVTIKEEYTVSDLRKDEVQKRITTISTFYLPPHSPPTVDSRMTQKLNLDNVPANQLMRVYPHSKWISSEGGRLPAYGDAELQAVKSLDNHTTPSDHRVLRASPALRQLMVDLALKPNLYMGYKADPASVVDATDGLTVKEKSALKLDEAGQVYKVMCGTHGNQDTVPNGIVAYPIIYIGCQ